MPLSDLTVVILSKNRHVELLRTLRYWDINRINYFVLHNTELPLEYTSTNNHSRYLLSKTSFGERCGLAAEKINTKYGIICSDDEVFLPSALLKMCRTLDEKKEIESVGGQTIAIDKYGPILTATPVYSSMFDYSNNSNSAISRLAFHFDNEKDYKNGAMYRLMRVSTLKSLLNIFSEMTTISTPYIYEVTGEILVTALGKSLYIEDIFWIRNWISAPIEHTGWNRRLYFYEWFEGADYQFEVASWVLSIEKCLLDLKIDLGFKKLLPFILAKRKKIEKSEQSKKSPHLSFVDDRIKYWIKRFLPLFSPPNSVEETIKNLRESKVLINEEEFDAALKSLTS